jgi:hypothetical protein
MWEHGRLPWKVISGGPGSGLYKSTDSGETWEKLKDGLPEEMGKMSIAVSRSNPEKVYALIESDSDKEAVDSLFQRTAARSGAASRTIIASFSARGITSNSLSIRRMRTRSTF